MTTIKELVQTKEAQEVFTTFPSEDDLEFAIEKTKDRFDFHRGQITNIGMVIKGEVKWKAQLS